MLGRIISSEGIMMDESKIKSIQEFPRPKGLKALRGFSGLVNYYRRFMDNWSSKLVILYKLLKKGIK